MISRSAVLTCSSAWVYLAWRFPDSDRVQTFTVLSREQDNNFSSQQSTDVTAALCSKSVWTHCQVVRSHALMVLSSEPEYSLLAEIDNETTGRWWPLRMNTGSILLSLEGNFQAMMRPSLVPANSISSVIAMEQTRLEGPWRLSFIPVFVFHALYQAKSPLNMSLWYEIKVYSH